MRTLTKQEARESLFSPITLGEKDFMLTHNEFNLLFKEFGSMYEFDAVNVYTDELDNPLARRKFIQNACYNTMTLIKTENMVAPEIEYIVSVKPILGDLKEGTRMGGTFSDGETVMKEDAMASVAVFNKNELQVVRVLRTTKSATEILENRLELHIFIPRLRLTHGLERLKSFSASDLQN